MATKNQNKSAFWVPKTPDFTAPNINPDNISSAQNILLGRLNKIDNDLRSLQNKSSFLKSFGKQFYFARTFWIAIHLIQYSNQDDNVPYCAHALRELMEKLLENSARLEEGSKINELIDSIESKFNQINSAQKKEFDSLFMAIEKLIETRKRSRISRRNQFFSFLEEFHQFADKLKEETKNQYYNQWQRMYGVFTKLAHHRTTKDPKTEFEIYLGLLEELLVDIFEPQPMKKFDLIDELFL